MAKGRGKPNAGGKRPQQDPIKVGADPESYLKETPVWRFGDFDWEGPWGETVTTHIANVKEHMQSHLASFETMTWAEILKASGGRGRSGGNNSHPIERSKFKKAVQERLAERKILADTLFSLRLDAGTRVYGVRERNCLSIVFFDPHHKDKDKCAYEFTD